MKIIFFPLKKLKVVRGAPTFTKSFVVQYGSTKISTPLDQIFTI